MSLDSAPEALPETPKTNKPDLHTDAVRLNPTDSNTWRALGCQLQGEQTAEVNGRSYSKMDCFTTALELDPNDWRNWANLACLPTERTIAFRGKNYSNVDCCVAALDLDPTQARAWHNLGYCLLQEQRVSVQGKLYRQVDCFVAALNIDPNNFNAWFELGFAAEANNTVVVQGKVHSQVDCYVAALNINSSISDAWNNLGNLLKAGQSVLVQGKAHSQIDCFVTALSIDPLFAVTWYNLGIALGVWDTAVVLGKTHSRVDCYVEAVSIEPSHSEAWLNLANCLEDDRTVLVQGVVHAKADCYAAMLNIDPNNCNVWIYLANSLRADQVVPVQGKAYSKAECYIMALSLEPIISDAWEKVKVGLGTDQFILIQGTEYARVGCPHEENVTAEEAYSAAWTKLGNCLVADEVVTVCDKQYSRTDCFIAALNADKRNIIAWSALGDCLAVSQEVPFGERLFTRFHCHFAAWQLLPKYYARSWRYLGARLSFGQNITYEGKVYRNYDCFITALNLNQHTSDEDDEYAATWNALGESLLPTPTLSVGFEGEGYCITASDTRSRSKALETPSEPNSTATSFSAFDCLVEAVLLDNASAAYWASVGQALLPDARITINEVEYTKAGCYLKALECDPNYAPAWVLLAECEAVTESIIVAGKEYSRKECCLEALRCKNDFPWAWRVLGDLINWEDSFLVNDELMRKDVCFERGLSNSSEQSFTLDSGGFSSSSLDGMSREGRSSTSSKVDVEIASVHPHSVKSMKLGVEIGKGSYGGVREVSSSPHTKNPSCVAKLIPRASEMFHSSNDLDRHVAILNDTQLHPNIVQTERIIFDDKRDELVNVMERMDGCLKEPGTEVELTREFPAGLEAIAVLAIARDILKALEHLEQMRIVHGDLKPENILYRKTAGPEEEWTYKLSDFDGAVKLNSNGGGSKLSTMGTLAYASPERLEENDEFPFAGDIWSLGVTLHVLRYARFPFPSWRTDFQLQRSILQGKLALNAPETDDPVEAVLQGIIVDMLTLDPAQRLRATALLKKLESVFGAPSDVAGSCGTSSSCSSMMGDWIDDSGFLTEVLC